MSWDYRPPTKFDARVSSMMTSVLVSADKELSYYFPTEAEARHRAEKFRYFRWCVRQDAAQAGAYYNMEIENDFRSKVRLHPQSGWHLSIRAIPARLGYMRTLNPWIDDLETAGLTNPIDAGLSL
jgi:hypothetical protein